MSTILSPQNSASHPHFPRLFEPLKLRHLTLKNRIAISGHHAGWWLDEGRPSDAFANYIEERARGGVGLFVIGCTSPKSGSGWLENRDDRVIPHYQKMADAGHRHGVPIFAQLGHPGFGPLPGTPLVIGRPHAAPTQPHYPPPERHVPSIAELQDLIESFGAAARRAALGGVDGLEIHSHEFFLHAQMLNPMWNQREDEYGGSLGNRMRFLIETLQIVRENIGDELALGVRLKADDIEQRGMNNGDYIKCIARLQALKLVDYVTLSGNDGRLHHGPSGRPEGEWLPQVKNIKANTDLVIMHAGRIMTPEMAEAALEDGVLDVVCMTKAHIADGQFARKVFENRQEDIRFCTRCLQGCHLRMHAMTCVYNPVTSRETTWAHLEPATRRRKIVVIGAGPAGMEAALTASLRGHDVIVLESSTRIGGQIWAGAASPTRATWARIAEFYTRQAAKNLFQTCLNTPAALKNVTALNPDAVIIATGSRPLRAEIAGGQTLLTVHEVLENGLADNAKNVVIYDREGFSRPFVVAEYLSLRGVQLHYVTPQLVVGGLMEEWSFDEIVRGLQSRGAQFYPGCDLVEWDESNVRLRDVQTGEERVLDDIDCIVGAVGSRAVNDLATPLRKAGLEVHVIGDANIPQTVQDATYQGGRIGRLL